MTLTAPAAAMGGEIALMAAVTAAAGAGVYRLTPGRSRAGWWVLGAAWGLLCVLAWLNVRWWTFDGLLSTGNPYLANYDADYNWTQALGRGGYPHDQTGTYFFSDVMPVLYDGVVLAVVRLLGRSVVGPIGLNVAAVLWSLAATSLLAWRLTRSRATAALAMGMTAAVAYWLCSGVILVKDALMQLSFVLLLAGCTALWRPARGRLRQWVLLGMIAGGLMITAMLRQRLMWAELPLVALSVRGWRGRAPWEALVPVAAGLAMYFFWSHVGQVPSVASYVSDDNIAMNFFSGRPTQDGYLSIIGGEGYARSGVWRHLALLPLSCAVQWVIPLPWHALRDLPFGPSMVYAHQGWAWYAVGGLGLYYAWRHLWGRGWLTRALWWGAGIWAMIAWMAAGTVSRYVLPLVPLFAVMGALAWRERKRERGLKGWLICYGVLMGGALAGAALV